MIPPLVELRRGARSRTRSFAGLSATLLAAFLGLQGLAAAASLLSVAPGQRFLKDDKGQPFLVVGDTAWSLIAQLNEEDAQRYLRDRQRRGFNSVIVSLIEHKFSSKPPATRAGVQPFLQPGDFGAPNPEYFDWARRVLERANDLGIVVWLAPAYLGYGGGDEGFFREIKQSGPAKLRSYGRYLGSRFKDLPNIVWMLGGDYTPEPADRWTIHELALGIRETDRAHLLTVHTAPEQTAAQVFGQEEWLSIETVYSYKKEIYDPLRKAFEAAPHRPFVLIESTYEGEHNSTPDEIRRQAYWAMLTGACGQFFGNNPIWRFDGPGLFPTTLTWTEALDAPGSRSMEHLAHLFRQLPWTRLRPDAGLLLAESAGNGLAKVLTARTEDGSLAVAYIPSTGTGARELKFSQALSLDSASLRWFDPASGTWTSGGTLPAGKTIRTPGENGSNANDWVLVLEVRQESRR